MNILTVTKTFHTTTVRNDSSILLISFCSADIHGILRTSCQEKNIEWFFWLKNFTQSDIAFITPNKCDWYTESKNDITLYLQSLIKQMKYNTVITFGASMGGYGALLFGSLLEADTIIAISPQTNISQNCYMNENAPFPFPRHSHGDLTLQTYDKCAIHIYCSNNEYDLKQIEYFVKRVRGVCVQKIEKNDSHGFIVDYSNEQIQEMFTNYIFPIINKFVSSN